MTDIKQILVERRLPETGNWFFDHFLQGDGTFKSQETENWDFKLSWPPSYSGAYAIGLCRLVAAFSNTSGGLIIFGVDDKTRTVVKDNNTVDLDKFLSVCNDYLSDKVDVDHRKYIDLKGRPLNVLAVYPRKIGLLPLRFKRSFENISIGDIFVRSGHEVIKADARHIPELFFRTSLVNGETSQNIDSALPPPPTTIKKFVGRLDVFCIIFEWIFSSGQPRQYLYGRGGSGKTAIAYELARQFVEYGSRLKGARIVDFDQVIFVSAKEKEYSLDSLEPEAFLGTDFKDSEEMLRSILILGGWSDFSDLESFTKKQLLSEFSAFIDSNSVFIIIDDIDTLTTKGIDPAFDDIYLSLARCKTGSKILYTLRNAPTHSLSNSIEVPGLQVGGEYERFIDVCCAQFKVDPPSVNFRDEQLAGVSERRPLVLEAIVRLRRTTGSYEKAIELFEANSGEGAREYVFLREWQALGANNHARYLLLMLALMKRPVQFEDLKTVLMFSEDSVAHALNEAREMFIDVEDIGGVSRYSVGELTRRFLLKVGAQLDRYDTIVARVDAFRKSIYPDDLPLFSGPLVSRVCPLFLCHHSAA